MIFLFQIICYSTSSGPPPDRREFAEARTSEKRGGLRMPRPTRRPGPRPHRNIHIHAPTDISINEWVNIVDNDFYVSNQIL